MRISSFLSTAAGAALLMLAPTGAQAATAITGFSGATSSFQVNNYDFLTVGWTFNPTTDLDITALGIYDMGADGLNQAHQIGIWNEAGTLLTSTTIAAGSAATLIGDYRYDAISMLTLTAGQTYTIGALMTYPDGDLYYFAPSSVQADSRIGYRQGVRSDEVSDPSIPATLVLPTSGVNGGRFGPNFLFDAASVAPEPASWAMMVIGFGCAGYGMRRRGARIARTA
jgi:hypothetical protein